MVLWQKYWRFHFPSGWGEPFSEFCKILNVYRKLIIENQSNTENNVMSAYHINNRSHVLVLLNFCLAFCEKTEILIIFPLYPLRTLYTLSHTHTSGRKHESLCYFTGGYNLYFLLEF